MMCNGILTQQECKQDRCSVQLLLWYMESVVMQYHYQYLNNAVMN